MATQASTEANAELVADVLWGFGPVAIEEQTGPEGPVLLAGFVDLTVAEAAAAAVGTAGFGVARTVPLDDDGLDGWRRWSRVEHAAPFTIVPAWLDAPAVAEGCVDADGVGRHVLRIEPGRTFGSGSHPTTRLVLGSLIRLVTPGCSVLDVGCGSGILSVAVAVLGAEPVFGIDIDESAPTVTAANAKANGVAGAVSASTKPLAEMAAPTDGFDLVLANVLAPVVVDHAEDLVRLVAPDGALVVSGLLVDRWTATTDHLSGLAVVDVAVDDGWVAVTLRSPPG